MPYPVAIDSNLESLVGELFDFVERRLPAAWGGPVSFTDMRGPNTSPDQEAGDCAFLPIYLTGVSDGGDGGKDFPFASSEISAPPGGWWDGLTGISAEAEERLEQWARERGKSMRAVHQRVAEAVYDGLGADPADARPSGMPDNITVRAIGI